jgi:hypothetical protein
MRLLATPYDELSQRPFGIRRRTGCPPFVFTTRREDNTMIHPEDTLENPVTGETVAPAR